jgi:hypothetical protein
MTIAFPSFDHKSGRGLDYQGPYARSTFMLSFEVPPPPDPKAGMLVPTYSSVGEEVSALLSGFFGKLIRNLGHLQAGNHLTVPHSWTGRCDSYLRPPFNGQPRRPGGPELNVLHAAPVLRAYFENSDDKHITEILRGCEFYRMALENYDERPEMAFALLISALECLVELREYSGEELYDKTLLLDMKVITAIGPDGQEIVDRLKKRLYQVRRKVALLVDDFISDAFFEQRECPFGFVVDRIDLSKRIKTAYDLRSRLLHTGNRRGFSHITHDHQNSEIVLGIPVLPDKNLVETLRASVNLTGLERITATVLRNAIRRHAYFEQTRLS